MSSRSILACWFPLVAAPLHAQRADSIPPGRWSALPVIGSAPETGVQYGATVVRVFRMGPASTTRASQAQFYAINTARDQRRVFLQLDQWSAGDAMRTRLRAEYTQFPLPFYPIVKSSPDTAEAWYTSSGPELSGSAQWRVRPGQYLGVGLRFRHVTVSKLDLAKWQFPSDPRLPGSTSGTLQLFHVADTRDNVISARRGRVVQLTASATPFRERGDGVERGTFGRLVSDARQYWSAGSGVIAARAGIEHVLGHAPFDMRPMVGSDTLLRGYVRGRYRDNSLGAVEVEYRSRAWRRFGFVAFGGAGVVLPTVQRTPIPTWGAGLRYLLVPAERLAIRVDYGRGKGSGGLYVALGEAF